MPHLISLIGPNADQCPSEMYQFGRQMGRALRQASYWLVCGGLGGWMEAVCRGAHEADNYTFGTTIGFLPGHERREANPYCDIVIPTGMGLARNLLVVQAGTVVVAVAGGGGTLSEIALAWQLNKKIIAYTGFEGWAKVLADTSLDQRRHDHLIAAATIEEVLQHLPK
ncbi:MAG: hypothetical protein OHK0053_13860 [Microscillaceae bacterium]